MLLFALVFILVYGSNVPHWDDVYVVPWLVGERPVTVEWLWSAHNEHRIPLPKLLLVGLAGLSGGDLRAAMTVNALTLAAAAAVLIWATRSRRGFTVAADAVFPLALLHVGQQQNLLWGFQVGFVVGAVLVSLLLAAVLRGGGLTGAAGAVLLLPLCGANTLAFAPPLAVWLGYAGLVRWRTDGPRAALPALAGAAGTAVLVGLYFLGWHGPPRETDSTDLLSALRIAGQFLSTAPGPAVRHVWPLAATVLAVLSLGTAVLLGTAAWRGTDRVRALGLLALLAGFAVLVAGVGWGRRHAGEEAGLASRYVSLMAPLVCLLYGAWELYLPAWARWAPLLIFTVLILLLVPNTLHGLSHGRQRREGLATVERDARAGLSPRELVRRHKRVICPPAAEPVAIEALEILRRRGLDPYSRADDE